MFGHVDVVPHTDGECYRSGLRDGKICGPGTGDRKEIVTLMLELFRYFHLQSPGISLGLAITTDEECGNLHSREELIDINSMLQFYEIFRVYLEQRLDLK
jgi:succinyl-diaminopimelate desuccinylase